VKELEKPQEQKLKVDHTVGAFNRTTFMWEHCPTCGSTKIVHEGAKGKYRACFECQIFLNKTDKNEPVIKEMKKE
jgi:RNA polymerase subunit RPABC4/transcription elongation factor Spt4